jgi:D-alanyl-lipoteichoic acid acyltransferase DltB (MBOAT superfamily)
MTRRLDQWRVLTCAILLIIVIFVVLKTETLAAVVAEWARARQGQDASIAKANDIAWLGFSYLAFRWIHTLRDRQTGKLPDLTLREYATYALFFPSYIAGPIDRAERFVTDFRALPQTRGLDSERIGEGLTRIAIGIFKKFVIADTLALGMALNATNAAQTTDTVCAFYRSIVCG